MCEREEVGESGERGGKIKNRGGFSSVCSKQSGEGTAGQGKRENLGHASLPREKSRVIGLLCKEELYS